MSHPTANHYTPLIDRLNACTPLITNSPYIGEPLRQELIAQHLTYAMTLTDLASGKLSESDAGVNEAVRVIPDFCALIEKELGEPASA